MAHLYIKAERVDTCPECGGVVDVTIYGGTNTTWGDEDDDDGQRTQHTDPLSDGYTVECRTCDYADCEPCEA